MCTIENHIMYSNVYCRQIQMKLRISKLKANMLIGVPLGLWGSAEVK